MFYDPFMCGLLLGAIASAISIMCAIEGERVRREERRRYVERKRHALELVAKSRAIRGM